VYSVLCTEDGPQACEDSKRICPASRAMPNFMVLLPCARFMTFGASYAGESIYLTATVHRSLKERKHCNFALSTLNKRMALNVA